MKPHFFILIAILFLGGVSRSEALEIKRETLFKSGQDGYHTYRIPSLIVTREGTVLAFCEGRKNSRADSGDIDLLVKRSEDGGKTWSGQSIVWDDGENTCGNPCPVIDQSTGRIVMVMNWNLGRDADGKLHTGGAEDTRRVFQCHSDDDGKTWTTPKEITSQAKLPNWIWHAAGPGVGIQLKSGPHKGRLVIPCDHTTEAYHYGANAMFSDDGGETWKLSNPIKPTCNECQVVELSDGRLLMSMRSQAHKEAGRPRNGYRSIAFSKDGGATWTEPEFDKTLGDPVCQASIIRYDDERLLYSYPASPISPKRGKRLRMTIRPSDDEGVTWSEGLLIDEGTSAYSCLTRLPDGEVGLIYESGADNTFVRVPIGMITGK